MKIRLEHNGDVFEYETRPMRSSRFRAICGVFLAAIYVGLVLGVGALCGFLGVVVVLVLSFFTALFVLCDN